MKRILSILLACILIMLPSLSFAAKQMNDGVPVWNEETVRQYTLDYIEGKSMDRLWGYYDLQIRRYMPEQTFAGLLLEWEWMTGDFVELGSYRCFAEPENKLKTHVLHLCMEKQDLDLYFTHKDKEDDWEVMALQFVPAEKEMPAIDATHSLENAYVETTVSIGTGTELLEGILTMPESASAGNPVPACVLVHDFDGLDKNGTRGNTSLFRDFAELFGEMGIATLRYDSRAYTYPDTVFETVQDEVILDALTAIELLIADERVDNENIVVLGLGFGAMMTPRIVSASEGGATAMILIGGSPEHVLQYVFERNRMEIDALPSEEAEAIKNVVRKIDGIKEEKAREVNMFGHNGYYYWEMAQYDSAAIVKKLRLPTFIAQGAWDNEVDAAEGLEAYKKQIGSNRNTVTYQTFRGLNHLLMNDLSTNVAGKSDYSAETHLDKYAGRILANWILNLNTATDK